jgi:serine-type D-Ala-D-Ala carboxypeptidase (penicillin-binding protein 5/6)
MSTSPLLTPGHRQRRRARARQRRRNRRAAWAAIVLVVAAGAVAAVGVSGSHRHTHAAASKRAAAPPAARPPVAQASSAIGLPLATSPLQLKGVGFPQRDPVRVAFRHPPRAGLLFDLDTGRILWQRNALRRVRIASLTKMMTALITVKEAPANARVLVTKEAVNSAGSKVGVLPLGKHIRLETMLYGLLLPSGNDAADALAHSIAGSTRAFVSRMNAEAARLGLGCTRYSSPSGFFDEGNFSCAADLAVLAHVDLEQPRIARITRTSSVKLPFPIKGGRLYLYNNNPLLIYHYPGLTGLKTGYTIAAGRCLVATAKRHGVRLGVVLLHSPAPATQARQLLDRGFVGIYHQLPMPDPEIPPQA